MKGLLRQKNLLCITLFISFLVTGPVACCGQSGQKARRFARPDAQQKFVREVSKMGKAIPPSPTDKAAFDRYVQEGWESPFGLDYVFIQGPEARDPAFVFDFGGKIGVRWVNFSRVQWQVIERKPPKKGKHNYNWTALDDGVRKWQHFGVHILMTLFSHNSWATATPSGKDNVYIKGPLKALLKGKADFLPKPEHMQDFRDYIFHLVERYDGDGVDDMPGLLFPVLHYQIGNEYNNELFWPGTVEQYKTFLKEASQAARKANPDVKIVLSGVNFRDHSGFYRETMDPRVKAYVETNMKKIGKPMHDMSERGTRWSVESMKACDDYDILDVRWPYYGTVKEGERLLKQFGCRNKEIWCAEIYSYFPLLPKNVISTWNLHPYPTPSKSQKYLKWLKQTYHPQFKKVNPWYRGMQAAQVVKYCMVGLNAGAKKLMMGWPVDAQTPLAPYPLFFDGLKSGTFKKLWPAGYAYRQVIAKLEGVQSCRLLPMPEYIYVYECVVKNGKKVIVAFMDDHIGQNHDEPSASMRFELPFRGKTARVTHVITEIDQTEARVETVKTEKGKLPLLLTEYPVFIEPQ